MPLNCVGCRHDIDGECYHGHKEIQTCFEPSRSQKPPRTEGPICEAPGSKADDDFDLRMLLWVTHHACPSEGLYGDDGEMQCNNLTLHEPIDFKRDSVAEIRRKLFPVESRLEKMLKESIGRL